MSGPIEDMMIADERQHNAIARLTRERDELQRRLEKWQRNEVQIGTNQQVARLLRERAEQDAHIASLQNTVAQVTAENVALEEEIERLREDAERYRWLRDDKHEVRMWSPDGESNRVRAWLGGDRLDAAIDAAMRGEE